MRVNIQPISKRDHSPDGSLLVHSIFHTIQGEGPLTGHPAIFVRLAGCNLQCPQCDTEYTEGARRMSATEVYAKIEALHPGPRLVVITGGEPLRQDITTLCWLLRDADYHVQVETNGTLPPPIGLPNDVWFVMSPKAGKVNEHALFYTIAFKYVLNADDIAPDGLPGKVLDHSCHPHVARPPDTWDTRAIYLQPADVKDEAANRRNLQACIASCMAHGYTLQLQIHKILNME